MENKLYLSINIDSTILILFYIYDTLEVEFKTFTNLISVNSILFEFAFQIKSEAEYTVTDLLSISRFCSLLCLRQFFLTVDHFLINL